MTYLVAASQAEPPLSLSTLRGGLAAIDRVHVEADLPRPSDDPAMNMIMRGLGRVLPRSPKTDPISALRIADLREVLRLMPDVEPQAVRDRALLLLHGQGLSDRHLSHLRWDDVRRTNDGLDLDLRHVLHGPATSSVSLAGDGTPDCPVRALFDWQTVATVEPPHVFTRIDRFGRRDRRYLHPSDIARTIRVRLDCLGPPGQPATPLQAARLLAGAPSIVSRDRALLLVGWTGAHRRREMTDYTWADVSRETPAGIVLRLRRSKTELSPWTWCATLMTIVS